MPDWMTDLDVERLVTAERMMSVLRAVIILAVGLTLARLVSRGVGRTVHVRSTPQQSMLARRFTYYTLFGLVVAATLQQLGFHLGVVLGAAGVLSVALGFASQTSASNLISGLFLIAERPFVVGDVIVVDGTTGEVLSVDLLSVKIRTFDNLLVRIPNETIIKSQLRNLTHFPIRRVDVDLGVAYKEDLSRVREILLSVAEENPHVLDDPAPILMVRNFGDSAIELRLAVWGARESYLTVSTGMRERIKAAFDAEGIEIPFPHRTLYAGSATGPMPVRVDGSSAGDAAGAP